MGTRGTAFTLESVAAHAPSSRAHAALPPIRLQHALLLHRNAGPGPVARREEEEEEEGKVLAKTQGCAVRLRVCRGVWLLACSAVCSAACNAAGDESSAKCMQPTEPASGCSATGCNGRS